MTQTVQGLNVLINGRFEQHMFAELQRINEENPLV